MGITAMLVGFSLGCVLIWSNGAGQQLVVQQPAINMAWASLQPTMTKAGARAATAAGAVLRHQPHPRRAAEAKTFMSAINFAARDDLLEEIRSTDLCGKPVAVFGTSDSVSYGDNFCDAIEELHSTFAAAGAKMLGYVSSDGYQHSESKSVSGDKFLGLPCDQDNEDDQSEDRVKAWVAQLKGEGMPL